MKGSDFEKFRQLNLRNQWLTFAGLIVGILTSAYAIISFTWAFFNEESLKNQEFNLIILYTSFYLASESYSFLRRLKQDLKDLTNDV